MLVFFTNLNLVEFQIRYLALFLFFFFWVVLDGKSSQEYLVNAGVPQNQGRQYEWRSSDSALGYFISKITSQEHRIWCKKSSFIVFCGQHQKILKTTFLPKGWWKIGYYEIEPKVKYWFGISMWLSKQNYKRISRNISLKQNIADIIKGWYQQKNNNKLIDCQITIFCFLRKKLYKTFHWMDQPLFYH